MVVAKTWRKLVGDAPARVPLDLEMWGATTTCRIPKGTCTIYTPAGNMALDKERHVKYWQRCHSMFLPSAYTGNESTRIMFALFAVSALDLLSAPIPNRAAIRRWVLSLQHPDGGFSGSPTHVYDGQDASKGSANLAATFFALVLLALAADSDAEAKAAFAGVHKRKLLRWMRKLQRDDGSFGQVFWDGEPVGGRDMRHSYLAGSIRWMLGVCDDDVDVDQMTAHIRSTQTYDGGIAEASEHESHGE